MLRNRMLRAAVGSGGVSRVYIAVGENSSPYISVWPFSGGGFGEKFSGPLTTPGGGVNGIAFSPSGLSIALTTASFSPAAAVESHRWSPSGFGIKNPGTDITDAANSAISISPDGALISYDLPGGAGYLALSPYSDVTGIGSRFSAPAAPPSGVVRGVAFSPGSDQLVAIADDSNSTYGYPVSGSGFGAKYANPATPYGAGTERSVAMSPTGGSVIFCGNQRADAYQFGPSGFGAFLNSSTSPAIGNETFSAISPDGLSAIIGGTSSPFLRAHAWSDASGFGSVFSDPVDLPTGAVTGIAFSPSGNAVAISHVNSPFITVYEWSSATGFGAKYPDPAVLPSSGNCVAFGSIS